MNILIAPDKFKGSLTAREVCAAIAEGLQYNYPQADITFAPLADGGDGTLAVLRQTLHLRPRPISALDPLGRPLEVEYLENDQAAFIEVAVASGLVLLAKEERDPRLTNTVGTGLQVRDALASGKRQISLLLGGSATNDLGLGIASALGYRFLNRKGEDIEPAGGNLLAIHEIIIPRDRPWENRDITLLCDVDNPLCGPTGAARMYAAQKGADQAAIESLEKGGRHVAKLIAATTGQSVIDLPGGGAAGGIGAGLVGLLGARITAGFTMISDWTGLEDKIDWADVVISGEGQLDEQSLRGKVVGGILEGCAKAGKTCYLFTGRNSLSVPPMAGSAEVGIFEIMSLATDERAAMEQAGAYLTQLARQLDLSYKSA